MERPIQNWAKVIFFDFDFTLGDSSEAIVECVNFALEKVGAPKRSVDEIHKTVGLPLEVIFKRFAVEDPAEAKLAFISLADKIMVEKTFLYKGVADSVREVAAKTPLRFGLISTKNHNRLVEILENYDLTSLFEVVVGADDVENQKPAPDSIFLGLRKMKVTADEAIFFGDSLADAGAAKKANVPFVGVTTGTTSEAALREAGAIDCFPNITAALNDLIGQEARQSKTGKKYQFRSKEQVKDEVEITVYRSSGPGGQHRNKVETAVRIKHLPTGLIVTATESRSQHKNRELAWERLIEKLTSMNAVAKKRVPTKRTKSSIEGRLKQKKKRSSIKKFRKPPSLED